MESPRFVYFIYFFLGERTKLVRIVRGYLNLKIVVVVFSVEHLIGEETICHAFSLALGHVLATFSG